jgi:hypothetical protein
LVDTGATVGTEIGIEVQILTFGERNEALKTNPLAVIVGLFVVSRPALAHHAFEAEFDSHQPLKLTGVLTKVDRVIVQSFS